MKYLIINSSGRVVDFTYDVSVAVYWFNQAMQVCMVGKD